MIARRQTEPITHWEDRKGWGLAQFQVIDLLKGDLLFEQTSLVAPCRIRDAASELFLLAGKRNDETASIKWRLSQPVTAAYREHFFRGR